MSLKVGMAFAINGHIGVLTTGLSMLLRLYYENCYENQKYTFTEAFALEALRKDFTELGRCFPRRRLLTQGQLDAVINIITGAGDPMG